MDVMVGTVAPKAGRKVDDRNKDLAFIFLFGFVLKGALSFQFFGSDIKGFPSSYRGTRWSFYTFYF